VKLLLDSHLLVWSSSTSKRLSSVARALINNSDNELFFSAASLWELAIKQGSGKRDFHVDAGLLRRGLLNNGYDELPVSGDHAVAIRALPLIHKDPFDRILIAQATFEGMTLLQSIRLWHATPDQFEKSSVALTRSAEPQSDRDSPPSSPESSRSLSPRSPESPSQQGRCSVK